MTCTDQPPDLVLRPAYAADADAIAAVHLAARSEVVPTWPRPVDWAGEVWVASVEDEVVGYLRLTGDWVEDLYVHPAHQRRGIGAALLNLARSQCPDGLGLWVFASNTAARAFYRRQGLVEAGRTDGSEGETGLPEVRLSWPGVPPPKIVGVSL